MANEEHIALVRQGRDAIAAWRRAQAGTFARLDLEGANLRRADLHEVDLREANLEEADLCGANLRRANLLEANLRDAALVEVNLCETELFQADLMAADLRRAQLDGAALWAATLCEADLTGARFGDTCFRETNFSEAKGLDTCWHLDSSYLDHRTISRSGGLPVAFLHGCGWPDALIETVPALLNNPLRFSSCFIRYSHLDEDFAQRLYADLQAHGVRCWLAPDDFKINNRFLDVTGSAIERFDKLVVVLSKNSLSSGWVQNEVETAIEMERRLKNRVTFLNSEWAQDEVETAIDRELRAKNRVTLLFPLQLDMAIEKTELAWARRLRGAHHISDFTQWQAPDVYQTSLARLLSDLRNGTSGQA